MPHRICLFQKLMDKESEYIYLYLFNTLVGRVTENARLF